jgi:glycosyltransferase involved in cell wall biosynthesis
MTEPEMPAESDSSAELLWLRSKLAEVVSNNNILEGRARKDIQAILDSRAWKMTRPIRFLAEKLRGRDACPDGLNTGLSPDSSELAAVSAPPPFRRHGTRIGVDISTLCEFDYETGIQRVVLQIARHLVESMPPGEVVLLDMRLGWPADATWRVVPSEQAKSTADWPVLDFKTLLLLDSSWHLVDVIGKLARAARQAGIEVVGCVYDLIPIDFPETCQVDTCAIYAQWMEKAVGWCDRFVCISEAVARRLVEYLRAHPGSICRGIGWWPLGCDFVELPTAIGQPPVSGSYALMVGTLEPRKRHNLAVDAFEKGWREGRLDMSLVIVGRQGWRTEQLVKRLKAHPERGKRLFCFGAASDAELAVLYANAAVILQASVAEGFGLPVVEGGRFGKPVVLSDIPVFRELVLEHGYFFTPDDPGSLLEALRRATRTGVKPTSVVQTSWKSSAQRLRDHLLDSSACQINI